MKPLNRTVCECGHKLQGNNIIPRLMNPQEVGLTPSFYGGNVKKVANAKCVCGKEYILFLKPCNNGYDIIDMSDKNGQLKELVEPKKYTCKKCAEEFEKPTQLAVHSKKCKG